jgi:poly-gamma-glutamate system protein
VRRDAPPFVRRSRVPAGALLAAALIAVAAWAFLAPGLTRRAAVDAAVEGRAAAAEARMTRASAFLAEAKRGAGVPRPEGVLERESGLVGAELTPLVTTLGSVEAKRLSASPRWAGELVRRLHRAGVREGSVVAASFSGSFPGLDLAVVSACAELHARLVAVSSVTASTWGATEPCFTWPEMEARLVAAGLVPRASVAVSVGGDGDAGRDLEPEARALATRIAAAAASKLGAELLAPSSLEESIDRRLDVYARHANGRPVALYVNCGGNEASLGRSTSFLRLGNGFLRGMPFDLGADRGVMARFAERGVPVLHLLNVRDLALRWGVSPQ